MRSPRFQRDPCVRDVASDPGRATAPRMAAPQILPSTPPLTVSAPAYWPFRGSFPHPTHLLCPLRRGLSPSTTQHALPGWRYPLPGPDFHRLDRASFAWRTNGWPMRSPADALPASSRRTAHGSGPMRFAKSSSQWTCTTYSLPVSRRTETTVGSRPVTSATRGSRPHIRIARRSRLPTNTKSPRKTDCHRGSARRKASRPPRRREDRRPPPQRRGS